MTESTVAVVVYPDVDELDVVGVFAPLVKARELGAPLRPVLVGTTRSVTGAAGLTFAGLHELTAVRGCAAIVVPGGRGAERAAGDAELRSGLQDLAGAGPRLYAVCTGVLVLAAAGLTRGRRVAVHARKHGLLAGLDVGEIEAGLIRDGDLTTIGGARGDRLKGLDIALALLGDLVPAAVEGVGSRLEVSTP